MSVTCNTCGTVFNVEDQIRYHRDGNYVYLCCPNIKCDQEIVVNYD